jgi:PIN domain nuclease of toxin-antitoxin system
MGNIKYLLDTHTLIWAACDSKKLGQKTLDIIVNYNSILYVSAVSAYEILYKYQIGKLPNYSYIADNYFDVLTTLGLIELPISMHHAHYAGNTNWNHRDPFDRLLVAQAHIDNLILITNDPDIRALSWVTTLW